MSIVISLTNRYRLEFWSIERPLMTPISKTLKERSYLTRSNTNTIRTQLRRGWNAERILEVGSGL
jgi:hypothetical protein